jgi:hypothetical protein
MRKTYIFLQVHLTYRGVCGNPPPYFRAWSQTECEYHLGGMKDVGSGLCKSADNAGYFLILSIAKDGKEFWIQ